MVVCMCQKLFPNCISSHTARLLNGSMSCLEVECRNEMHFSLSFLTFPSQVTRINASTNPHGFVSQNFPTTEIGAASLLPAWRDYADTRFLGVEFPPTTYTARERMLGKASKNMSLISLVARFRHPAWWLKDVRNSCCQLVWWFTERTYHPCRFEFFFCFQNLDCL